MSYLDRIAACNRYDPSRYLTFDVAGRAVGRVDRDFAAMLRAHPTVFRVGAETVALDPALADFESRSRAVEAVLRHLAEDGLIAGWRDEAYPVAESFSRPALMRMERAAIPFFGVPAYGVHLNGIVRTDNGLGMWIAFRSPDKPTFPGMLDNMVAGGQPIGLGLVENLIKECWEEASVPAELAATARPVGAVSYCMAVEMGLKPDRLFNFDLDLPADFVPVPRDGEIARFELWPIEEVAARVRGTADFKPNCNLTVIDFLIRHGVIAPDDPDYLEIVAGLHG